MSGVDLYQDVAAAVAVDDDVLPDSIARAGDIEEAIFWLLAQTANRYSSAGCLFVRLLQGAEGRTSGGRTHGHTPKAGHPRG